MSYSRNVRKGKAVVSFDKWRAGFNHLTGAPYHQSLLTPGERARLNQLLAARFANRVDDTTARTILQQRMNWRVQ